MSDVPPWINLLATLGLLAVTYWYARTTKEMATSAQKAATSSECAAEAARDAASVAQSQIKPEFTVRIVAAHQVAQHVACLLIESVGDAVVVRQVRVRRAYTESPITGDPDEVVLKDLRLEPLNDEMVLPRRLHGGEPLLVTHPDLEVEVSGRRLVRALLDVDYTFTETGSAGGTRSVSFSPQGPVR